MHIYHAVILCKQLSMPTAQAETFKWITFKPLSAGDAQVRSTEWLVNELA
ncbi:hypothetical protein [Amphritea atlantica]|nr:hypothetical protein [Amphritea atlantica]